MSDEQQTPPMATPRVAAGALFWDEDARALLVKPAYKNGWDIPGGYVEPGEAPLQAAQREVKEELGITPSIGRILVVDWAPHPDEGDKLLFIFDGGILKHEAISRIHLDSEELASYAFIDIGNLSSKLVGRLHRRVQLACHVRNECGPTIYAEHGVSAHLDIGGE
jgi:8-oxo-dGTP diphosphatase